MKIHTTMPGTLKPFFREELELVTVQDALQHPNWVMGAKITVDSATMMNKGLEIIEAHHLFGVPYSRIQTVLHKESIIHSLVEFHDMSMIAHLGNPDMRVPIAYALGYPNRITSGVDGVSLDKLPRLEFFKPDLKKFRCLDLSYQCLEMGAAHCINLNASNEIAVEAFLLGKIGFMQIPELIEKSLLGITNSFTSWVAFAS